MTASTKLTMIIEMADKMSSKLGKLQSNWSKTVDKMKMNFDGFINKLPERFQNKISQIKMPNMSGMFGFGIGAGIGMQAVEMVKNGITSLGSEAIDSVDALKKFESTMGFGGFDGATIKNASAMVKKYADDTVYDLSTISNTTAQLAANGIKDYTGLTQAAGNLNAVAGGNADTFKSVGLVLTQTAGAGKLTTENWNQMANAIPGASGKLQESMRRNGAFTGNFREAMEKGLITADAFNAAIMELGNEPIAVEAAKSTKTFEGAIGQMKANVVEVFSDIIQSIGTENITGAITAIGDALKSVISVFTYLITEFRNGNPIVQILVFTIAALTAGIIAYNLYTGLAAIPLKALTAAQWLLNIAMDANPIGLIIAAIVILIALVTAAIYKYDQWGAALLYFLGPIGMVINAFKSIYDHWESIKKAFQTDGIIGGLKRLGVVLLDALLKPFQQILEIVDKVAGTNWAKTIQSIRQAQNLVTPGEIVNGSIGNTGKLTHQSRQSEIDKAMAAGFTGGEGEYLAWKKKNDKSTSLYTPTALGDDKKKDKKSALKSRMSKDVDKISGAAKEVKNITIRFDSVHRGDNIINNGGGGKGMSMQDFENFYNEMMMRIIRNVETS